MSTRRRARPLLITLLAVAATVLAGPATASAEPAAAPRWVGGWAAAPLAPGPGNALVGGFADDTFRNIVRVRTSAEAVRVRLTNRLGTAPLRIDSASVAEQAGDGAGLVAGTREVLRFGGSSAVTIPAGQDRVSDPVPLAFSAGETGNGVDLAVSLHVAGSTGRPTYHQISRTTSYIGRDANRAQQDSGAGFSSTSAWWFVAGVEVSTRSDRGTVVALGDSITDGYGTAPDSNTRWTDYLAKRLQTALPAGQELSVVNQGISGGRLLSDSTGAERSSLSAEHRFQRDVLDQPSVRSVIVLLGTNDLESYGGSRTSGEITRGLQRLADRAHAAGIRIIGATIPPRDGASETIRNRRDLVNEWIRTTGSLDGVLDVDRALRADYDRFRLKATLAADTVHPDAAGNREIADRVDLSSLG